jgi:hypothetical protein
MWEPVKALEDRNPVDQLACLVLRVLAELTPCTERLFIERLSGGDLRSQPGQASHSHTRELVHSTLLKLKALAFIEFSQERIAITDEGKRCLVDLLVTLQSGPSVDVRDAKADRQVATDHGERDGIEGTTKTKVTQPGVSSRSQLPARLYARYRALLSVLVTTLRSEYARLKRFCQDHLTKVSVAMPRVCKPTIGRACDCLLYVRKHKIAPMIRSGATALVHVRMQLAKLFDRAFEATGKGKIGARLSKVTGANGLLPDIKFAGFDSRSINYAGPLLLVCGALSIAGGVLFFSSERANSSRADETSLSSDRTGSSRVSPIVWFHDGQDRLGRSIFVTRRLEGAAWIEGLAISGQNASDQTLTGLRGAIKTDSGEQISLSVTTDDSQGKWTDAEDVLSGSKFTLRSAANTNGTQTGMPAEEFLSKHGGMIFRVSYVVAGVQTTMIEYFSTSQLRAQLANMN